MITTIVDSFYPLACRPGPSALYENGVTRWFPGYQNGITLTRSTAAVGPAEFLKDLAKWEIKASETTNFEYNNKPGTGQWKPGY